MSARLVAGVLLAGAMLARGASADEQVPRWSIELGGGAHFLTDPADSFATGSGVIGVGDLRLGYTPGWLHDRLELEFAFAGGAVGSSAFQSYDTEVQRHSFELGARYRFPIGRHFNFFARGAFLVNVDGLSLDSEANTAVKLGQFVATAGLELAVGAEWLIVARPRFGFGIQVEGGYSVDFTRAQFSHVTATGTNEAGTTPLSDPGIDAGAINMSGPDFRVGVAFHF